MKTVPHAPAKYSRLEAYALKALAKGAATEGQQKTALDWIIRNAAMTYDETFVAGQQDAAAFLQGRRNVGLQIVKLINLPIEQIRPDEPERKS